jgi:hypothetical protein
MVRVEVNTAVDDFICALVNPLEERLYSLVVGWVRMEEKPAVVKDALDWVGVKEAK